MPTHNDETLLERYQREALEWERIESAARERQQTLQSWSADDTEGGA